MPLTLLCIATYRKGDEFLRECRRQRCRVLLLTEEKLRGSDWPREAIDDFYYIRRGMPEEDIRRGAAHLARRERIDRIVALDDFDVELAAMLREYLHVPGMGETTARAFRDKLAMRNRARLADIPCPDFVHLLNLQTVSDWVQRVRPPWVLKPRSQAAAIGIRRLWSADELWQVLQESADSHGEMLLEAFVAGAVYHVDSIVFDRRVRFAVASRYKTPPMEVAHGGGIFVTQTLDPGDAAAAVLLPLNERVLETFGLRRGASHTEFIQGDDGGWYFLETSARVGGAFIADVIEAATGINLWRDWAKAEIAGDAGSYDPEPGRRVSAGIILSLARQADPDTTAYDDPEVVKRIRKSHHAGLILASPDSSRIAALLDDYTRRFYTDFHASAPPPARALD